MVTAMCGREERNAAQWRWIKRGVMTLGSDSNNSSCLGSVARIPILDIDIDMFHIISQNYFYPLSSKVQIKSLENVYAVRRVCLSSSCFLFMLLQTFYSHLGVSIP